MKPVVASARAIADIAAEYSVVAEIGPRIIGFHLAAPVNLQCIKVTAQSLGAWVEPAYRGIGISRAMRSLLVELARDCGIERIINAAYTEANATMVEKYGWRRYGWLMEKEIS